MSWILESEIEELKGKLKRIEELAMEGEKNNQSIKPSDVLDIINDRDYGIF